jgi:hypothetical protein
MIGLEQDKDYKRNYKIKNKNKKEQLIKINQNEYGTNLV